MKPYVTFMDDVILEGATPQQELPEGQMRAPGPVEAPPSLTPKELKDTHAEELGVPPILQEASGLDATVEEPMDGLACSMATVEELTDGLATLTATVGELAEQPDTPLCSRR